MKSTRKLTGIIAAFAVFASAAVAQAQQKIAVVDLQKVFDGYYKTKIADKQLKEQGAEFEDTLKSMYKDYEGLNKEHLELREKANDQILSADAREKRNEEAQGKLREIKELEENIKQFDRTAKTTLAEKQRRLRNKILDEVSELVNTKARAASYSLVLDLAALSKNDTKVVVYSNNEHDMTKDILATLNATAPPDFKAEADAK